MTENTHTSLEAIRGHLTYDDKVIEKIIGLALEGVDGLLEVKGGFFADLKNKVVTTDTLTEGIKVEVGQSQVAVDLDVIVEYKKHVASIYEDIKRVAQSQLAAMTDLDLVEVNVNVVDIKTRAQHEADSVSLQDRVTGAAQATGQFVSEQVDNLKAAVANDKENSQPRVV